MSTRKGHFRTLYIYFHGHGIPGSIFILFLIARILEYVVSWVERLVVYGFGFGGIFFCCLTVVFGFR